MLRRMLGLLVLAACASTQPQSLEERGAALARRTGRTSAGAFQALEPGRALPRNEHESMHAASTMKVPVMLALFDAISRGDLDRDQPVEVRNEFKSILDGSTYSLEARED